MRRARLDGPTGELTSVAELGRVLAAATNLRGALARVVEHLEDLVGATSVGVWVKDEADEELRVVAATGLAWQGAAARAATGSARASRSGSFRPAVR